MTSFIITSPRSLWLAGVLLLTSCSGCGQQAAAVPSRAPQQLESRELERRASDAMASRAEVVLVATVGDAGVQDAAEPATIAGESIAGESIAAESIAAESIAAASAVDGEVESAPAAAPIVRRRERFFGHADAPIRRALATEEIAEVRRGGGGRSLSFRVTLADGTRGYFKPEQTFNGMRWQSEIAAYHLDRELGLGRVAPVVGRSIPYSELRAAAGGDGRVDELRVGDDGALRGAFIWWVPERVTPLPLPQGWERWLRIEGAPARITPFQRPNEYRHARAAGTATPRGDEVPAMDRPDRAAELSDMIVFDYLTQNLDRWGTNNTNVRTVGPGGPLMFLDNAASFVLRSPRIGLMDARLAEVQRFRRSTINAVRRFDQERFAERLASDPLAPELDRRQLANLELRRAHLLDYVDALIEEHGEDAVYAW